MIGPAAVECVELFMVLKHITFAYCVENVLMAIEKIICDYLTILKRPRLQWAATKWKEMKNTPKKYALVRY